MARQPDQKPINVAEFVDGIIEWFELTGCPDCCGEDPGECHYHAALRLKKEMAGDG